MAGISGHIKLLKVLSMHLSALSMWTVAGVHFCLDLNVQRMFLLAEDLIDGDTQSPG